nr:hypothetical protein [Scardovia inopinata]
MSYWTQHPQLTNCMIASVDGTEVESVVNMAVNMYKNKRTIASHYLCRFRQ